MLLLRYISFLGLVFLSINSIAFEVAPLADWQTLKTPKLDINYQAQDKELAEKVLAESQLVLPQIEKFLNWQVKTRIYINIVDRQDSPNGWATALPFNHITLYTTPPTRFSELNDFNQWTRLLLAHELTHIVHLDKGDEAPLALRSVFGRFPLLFPNNFQPNFLTEGLATYVETNNIEHFGRGQSTYFNMMMRTEVTANNYELGNIQQYRSNWPFNTAYLYGVYFYQFLEENFGKASIPKFIGDYSTHLLPFLLSSTSYKVTNRSTTALWNNYLRWLNIRFQKDIDTINTEVLTSAQTITNMGYGNHRPIFLDDGRIVYRRFSDKEPTTLVIDDLKGNKVNLGKVGSDAQLIGVINTDIYFLQTSPCGLYSEYSELFRVNMAKASAGESSNTDYAEKISTCGRYTHAAISPDKTQIALVQSLTGKQQLVIKSLSSLIDTPLWVSSLTEHLGDLSWQDDHNLIISSKKPDQKWHLYAFNIDEKKWGNTPIISIEGNQQMPFMDNQNNTVYFSSDHTGIFDIYRFNFATQTQERITRSLSGSAYPIINQDALLFMNYTRSGWDVKKLSLPLPAITDSPILAKHLNPNSGIHINWPEKIPTPTASTTNYSAFPSVLPTSWFISGYNSGEKSELGIQVNGNDALYFHRYIVGASYDVNLQETSGLINYIAYNHFSLNYQKSYNVKLSNDKYYATANTDIQAAMFAQIPFQYAAFNALIGFNRNKQSLLLKNGLVCTGICYEKDQTDTVGLYLNYNSSQYFLNSISESHGRDVHFTVEQDHRKLNTSIGNAKAQAPVTTFTWNEFISLGNRHVLALSAFIGRGGKAADPFILSDDLNASLSNQNALHARKRYLRGYPNQLSELSDINTEIYSAEWRFPLYDIEKGISGIPIGAHKISGALFYDNGSVWGGAYDTNPSNRKDRKIYDSVGAEINTGIDFGYSLLPLNLKLGVAQPLTTTEQGKSTHFYLSLGLAM